jgi:hypothetical protein
MLGRRVVGERRVLAPAAAACSRHDEACSRGGERGTPLPLPPGRREARPRTCSRSRSWLLKSARDAHARRCRLLMCACAPGRHQPALPLRIARSDSAYICNPLQRTARVKQDARVNI